MDFGFGDYMEDGYDEDGLIEELEAEFEEDLSMDDLEHELEEDLGGLDAADIGLAMSFADHLASRDYEVDENTDRENWEAVKKLVSLQSRHQQPKKKLRRFESYVQEILDGKRSIFDD
jgi:hypothetical protein